jgi:hypothetical protein
VPSASRDPRTHRFAVKHSLADLEEIVRAICLQVDPRRPHTVATAAFNDALAKSGWSDAPNASGIRRRFADIPWRELLQITFDPGRDLVKTARARSRRAPTAPPDEAEAAYALKLAAAASGSRWRGRPHQYEQVERQLRQQAKRRYRHGSDPDTLMFDRYEIENALATESAAGWDRGLHAAGLPARSVAGGSQAGHPPVVIATWFVEEVGCVPWSHSALRTFAKQKKEGLATYLGAISPLLDELRAVWPAGRWLPPHPPKRTQRPPIQAQPLDTPLIPYRPRPTREQIIEGLAVAYETIWPDTHLSQIRQNRLHEDDTRIPRSSLVQKEANREPKTTAAALRRAGQQLAAARRGAAR